MVMVSAEIVGDGGSVMNLDFVVGSGYLGEMICLTVTASDRRNLKADMFSQD